MHQCQIAYLNGVIFSFLHYVFNHVMSVSMLNKETPMLQSSVDVPKIALLIIFSGIGTKFKTKAID